MAGVGYARASLVVLTMAARLYKDQHLMQFVDLPSAQPSRLLEC